MEHTNWNPNRWRAIAFLLLAAVAGLLSTSTASAQVQDRINRGCGGLGGTLVQVLTDASGNIYMITCTGKQVFINGSPIVPGGPTGSGTAGTIPLWTSSTVLGNSLLTQTATSAVNLLTGSFNYGGIAAPAVSAAGQGKFYFDSGTNTFKGSYNGGTFLDLARSNVTNGTLPVANSTGNTFGNSFATQSGTSFSITQGAGGNIVVGGVSGIRPNIQVIDATSIVDVNSGGNNYIRVDGGNDRVLLGNQTAGPTIRIDGGGNNIQVNSGAGQTLIGDTGGVGNGVLGNFDDGSNLITLNALNTSTGKSSGDSLLTTDAQAGITAAGDVNLNGLGTLVTINDPSQTITLHAPGGGGGGTNFVINGAGLTYTANKLPSCTVGIVTDASGVLACAVSDGRLKADFSAYRGGLAAIAKLRPQSYNFRAGTHYDADLRRTGFVAQEVQKAVPEAVLANASGQLSVDPMTLIGTLVNATNELAAQVKSLQAQVTRLKRAGRRH